MLYESIVRPILFRLSADDPEEAHEAVLTLLRLVGKQEWLANLIEQFSSFEDSGLEQELFGLKFRNPVGLAAGFDKNAIALRGLQTLGFGFLEVGTVTRYEQEGNPRPRIFRFPENKAIINRMGFNNDGADKIGERLAKRKRLAIPLGISLGKSKITLLEKAVDDYLYSLRKLYPYGDYFIVNVSSPNTPGLRQLQERKYLDTLLFVLQRAGNDLAEKAGIQPKPILVKIAPDLGWEAINEVLEVCLSREIDGLIAVNTTITRDGLSVLTEEEGGLSGPPLWPKAISVVRYIYEHTEGKIPIIGVGGISGAEETYEMLKFVNLTQVLTSFIYRGPFIARQINKGLRELMDRDGIKHISELRR
jgi:dihydroorotate dehydrogenase